MRCTSSPIGAALQVSPVHLLLPIDDETEVAVTPTVTVSAARARSWIRGETRLSDADDPRTWISEVDEASMERLMAEGQAQVHTTADMIQGALERGINADKLMELQERLIAALAKITETEERPEGQRGTPRPLDPKKVRIEDMGVFEVTSLPKGSSRGISPELDEVKDALDADTETVEEER